MPYDDDDEWKMANLIQRAMQQQMHARAPITSTTGRKATAKGFPLCIPSFIFCDFPVNRCGPKAGLLTLL